MPVGVNAGRAWNTRYAVSGSGPVLVLIHGVGLDMTMWQRALPLLEPRFTVIRYDLVGHGKTPAIGERVALADFVGQLQALLVELGVTDASVLGFSLGGIVARGWAAAFPLQAAKLVVLCSIAPRSAAQREAIAGRLAQLDRDGPGGNVDTAIERWFTPAFIAREPAIIAQVRATVLANKGPGYPAAYRFFATADDVLEGLGGKISCPTLAITAENDIGSTPEMARRLALETKQGTAHIVPGLRHMAVVESPEAVLGPVLAFLAASQESL